LHYNQVKVTRQSSNKERIIMTMTKLRLSSFNQRTDINSQVMSQFDLHRMPSTEKQQGLSSDQWVHHFLSYRNYFTQNHRTAVTCLSKLLKQWQNYRHNTLSFTLSGVEDLSTLPSIWLLAIQFQYSILCIGCRSMTELQPSFKKMCTQILKIG